MSAVFIWSTGITFVYYQLLNSWHMKVVDSFQDHLKMGTRQADFSQTLDFRNLERSHTCQATTLASQDLPVVVL